MATKKVMRFVALTSFVLAMVLFLALSIQFDSDPKLFSLLENNDVISTLHRLSVYYIPGICMIGGFFALVFTTRKILVFMALVQLCACYLLRMYIGDSVFMMALFVIYLIVSIMYLGAATVYKSEIKRAR